ncbi:complement C3-like [Antennarius striatus]|uniref:complement C3-like n=1 Tax=Antennarius striatus TaxID=241820 RepID=UPI0035B1A017
MDRTRLWLLAFLGCFTDLSGGSSLKVMSSPNVLRVGTPQNIFVECQDCSDLNDFSIRIHVLNHPAKTKNVSSTSVTLTRARNFQGFGQIVIPADDFRTNLNTEQYVYLQAQFPDQLLEKVVLVSMMSAYIFIQTDKTLYTPNQQVLYRILAVTANNEPVNGYSQSLAEIFIDIVVMYFILDLS